ncbi:hypothetical protein RJ639_036168 [Escallonia herrerae]|uniref:Zinc finger, CCHC-type n=1 Tax=Escallonia herrerae TaxID=1293975 RepID=A0AA89BBW9_9ASTE|nr:hypothetical protein RJ639_036168 [Escallonia herrerae]
MVNAKALWESLERKYKTEDAGSKKFVVGKFLDFKMVDSKTVISQVQEFQLILHDIHAEGMVLGESFQVAALIENLPPTWKDFKNYLKYKRKEMKLEDLIVRLRIEEDNRQSEKRPVIIIKKPRQMWSSKVNSNGEPRREFDSLSLRLYSSRNGANGLLTKSLPGYNGSTSGNRSTPNLQTRRTKTMAQNSFGHRNETTEKLQNLISG